MKKTDPRQLLKQVRMVILAEAARGARTLGLSWLTLRVTPAEAKFEHELKPRTTTSRAPKKLRGSVQHALTILAHQGLLFSRTHPESGVERWAHGEADKFFQIRIGKDEAIKRLKRG
jgi:hypothetical protein